MKHVPGLIVISLLFSQLTLLKADENQKLVSSNPPEVRIEIIENAPHSFHLRPKQRDLRHVVTDFFDKHLKPK